MATVTAKNALEIFLGTPTVSSAAVTFFGLGDAGTPGAARILTHPTTGLAPIVYPRNPDRDLNLDNDIILNPITQSSLTMSSRRVVRFEQATEDGQVTEIWEGSQAEASMTTAFWRSLYEYHTNQPAAGEYITWQPRDRNAFTYQVELVDLSVGGSSEDADLQNVTTPGGGTYKTGLEDLSAAASGLVDREVRLVLRIVAKV